MKSNNAGSAPQSKHGRAQQRESRTIVPKPILQPAPSHTEIDREDIYDLLMNARQARWVELEWRGGNKLSGAIIFNEFKGTGRLINIDEEISIDFKADEIVGVSY